MEINLKLQQDDGKLLSNPLLYRQLVKSLNYLMTTQFDVSFVV